MKILSLILITFFTLNFAQSDNKSKNHVVIQDSIQKDKIYKEIKSGDAKFISFGIAMHDFSKFKEKYGIDLKTEGCVIDPRSSKRAIKNNTILADYLKKKYGDSWRNDLPFLPFGL